MQFSLSDLLGHPSPEATEDFCVSGVNADSRMVGPGEVFFALPGTSVHGAAHAAQAVEQGAVAVVSDRALPELSAVPVVVVDDVRSVYAKAAAKVMAPQPEVAVAVTGTNGKTSVVSFVRQIWQANGLKAASVGTLGVDTGGKTIAGMGSLTTPDALSLHKSLAVLKASGFDHVALEASSHGLDQRRLDGFQFQAVGFTNLSRDHLDYHADMDAYREAKLHLFRQLLADGGAAVVNTDDAEHAPFMFAALDRGASLLTVGTEGAFIEISSVTPEGLGQRVVGKLVGEPLDFVLPLVGRFQVDNAIMAAALAMQTGADPEQTVHCLNRLKGAKGRMENVGTHRGATVFIDYSHKPVALETALATLRPFTKGKLMVVFGCGGDRDRGKRPIMGEIATRLADFVIVTDDNPRHEDAETIRKEILASAPDARDVGDRAAAIESAMAVLDEGDVLLIAGKGHEDYQIIGDTKQHFSDHEVVASVMGKA